MSINYSDGDIENIILDFLKSETNLSSSNNIQQKNYQYWPIKYHLSSIRHNSIKHLDFTGLKVLEFGAGMGAMSRYVAEQAKHLTVVEGTETRFSCLQQRLRDLDNWNGVVANYQDYKSDEKYDVVCFFGVLEYAGKYIDKENPFEWAINHAKSFLKEDGILLISIENKLGLKYFAGSKEDHYGKYFSGICGYPMKNATKTFSKKEMLNMLEKVGFEKTDVHHLYPDYKLTRAVLTDAFVEEYPQTTADIIGEYVSNDNGQKYEHIFPEPLAALGLVNTGLLGEFSNSYLFLAQTKKDSEIVKTFRKKELNNKVAFLYTDNRQEQVTTSFIKENNEIEVVKYFNSDINEENIISKEMLIQGDKVSTMLMNYAYYNYFEDFMFLLGKQIKTVLDTYSIDNTDYLDIKAYDCITKNTILSGNDFIFFDFEYQHDFKLRKSHFIYRNIMELFTNLSTYSVLNHFTSFSFTDINEIYYFFCKINNVKENFEEDYRFEIEVLNSIIVR